MSQILPGQLSKRKRLERIIRVDHAGEYGAKRIYQGQLDVLRGTDKEPIIQHMADQEQEHLEAFEKYIVEKRVRPSLLHPFWHISGYMLGFITAKMGPRAAMACTVAVEEVIDEHYQKQLEELGKDEPDIRAKIEKFRQDEQDHRDTGLEHEAELTPAYELLRKVIGNCSKAAIWVAERV